MMNTGPKNKKLQKEKADIILIKTNYMKTAVEWLVEELKENNLHTFNEWKDIFQQAKEMEKQQIIKAYENTNSMAMYGEDYYNETFKSE